MCVGSATRWEGEGLWDLRYRYRRKCVIRSKHPALGMLPQTGLPTESALLPTCLHDTCLGTRMCTRLCTCLCGCPDTYLHICCILMPTLVPTCTYRNGACGPVCTDDDSSCGVHLLRAVHLRSHARAPHQTSRRMPTANADGPGRSQRCASPRPFSMPPSASIQPLGRSPSACRREGV